MESTESKLRGLHNHLSVVLSEHITEVQIKKLKQHFRLRPFGDGTLEKIKGFLNLWNELETAGIISVQMYGELELAFDSIQASCHNDVIQEFTVRMRYEGATNDGWVRHDKVTLTRAEFDQLIVEYKTFMERLGPKVGTVHIFENVVFGLIPRSGGELTLKNGTAKLQIPPGAVPKNDQEMFWIFRPPADAEDEEERSNLAFCCEEGQSLENVDAVVKYSLPVTLGPPDVDFHKTSLPKLTLKEYSFPECSSAPLSVYRMTGDNGTWEKVGSCFLDKERRLATVSLVKFSSYVVGLPATSELLPLNVHIMVQRLPKKKDDTTQPCDMQVVFSMNDHTYIQEMVLRKRMNIVCETSYYLEPKSDVNIRWEKRNSDGSVYLKQTVVLKKGRLNRLAKKMQSVTIPIKNEKYLDKDHKDFVILEQNDTNLVELACRDNKPMKVLQDVNGCTLYQNIVLDKMAEQDAVADSMENYLHSVVQQHIDWLACTRQLCKEADTVLETFCKTVIEAQQDGEPPIDPFCFPSEKDIEERKKILENKAAIIVTGNTNCGKSSLLNTIFRAKILPVSANPCNARVVRLKYSEIQYQQLITQHGTEFENVHVTTHREIRNSPLIRMSEDARNNKEFATMVVEVGLRHELLQSGIEVLDSPGKSENPILDEVVDNLLATGKVPLVVYVIDGRMGLLLQDIKNIDAIQSKLPNSTIMFVCNKCDDDDEARSFDHSYDDDDDDDYITVAKMKKRTFEQLRQHGFIPKTDEMDACKCFHGLSAFWAMRGYKKEKFREQAAEYMKNFDIFEKNLVDVLFAVLQNDISRIINIVMNNLATCNTIFDWAILGQAAGPGDSEQLLSVVEEAQRIGKWWYDELVHVLNTRDIAAHINFAMDLIERDLLKEIPSFTQGRRTDQNRDDDLQFLELKSRLDELGFNADEMARKGTFCHTMRKMFASYLFNTFKVTLEIRYKAKMDTLSTELVNIMFTIAPSLRNMLKCSYRVRPSMMFDCDQLLGCTNLLFDVLQMILDAGRLTLRNKVDEVCDNYSIMYILMADNMQFSAEWCKIFAKSLVSSVDVPTLVRAIQDAALGKVADMFSSFTSSLTMIQSISSVVKYQEESVLTTRKSAFMEQYMMCQAQAYGIQTCMQYPSIQDNFAERIAVSQSGFPIRACQMTYQYCGGYGSHLAVKIIARENSESRGLQIKQLLKTSEIQQHKNLLLLHGWILPSADCRLVIMDRAEMNLVDALPKDAIHIHRMNYGLQIGRALLHLAAQQPSYYFMDLKPRNVLIGKDGEAKLNICKVENLFRSTAEIRLPFHVSPQVYSAVQRGETSFHPSNQIYAYGTLLWILAHGRVEAPPAFRSCNDEAQVQLKLSDGILPPKLENIPTDHWCLIEQCLKNYENLALQDVVNDLDQKLIIADRNQRIGR